MSLCVASLFRDGCHGRDVLIFLEPSGLFTQGSDSSRGAWSSDLAIVPRVVIPIMYVLGSVMGKYSKFTGARAPISRNRT